MTKENFNRISAYCTVAERCVQEVREKMRKLEYNADEMEDYLKRLIDEGFVDEGRYAIAFTKDKFRFAKWGKRKIEYALRAKGIDGAHIQAALETIDDGEYEALKKQLAEAKAKTLKGDKNDMTNRAKILRFLASRGFIIAVLLTVSMPQIMASGYIEGRAKEYAGRRLELLYEDNGITGVSIRVDTCVVDSTGAFKLETDVTETRKCYIPLGAYKGVLYVEPYKIYNVNLPPLTMPKEGDSLNPYYAPQEILLSLNNPASDDLNLRITAFDDSFDVAFNRIIKSEITPENIEKEYADLEYDFGDQDPFFTTYRYCNYAILVNLYEPTQPATAIDAFFLDAPVAYSNPAYWDAFNILFEQFKDIETLRQNPDLYEIVILHHVLSGQLTEEWLTHIKSERNLILAQQVEKILKRGSVGTQVPVTEVVNIDGEKLSLKDFETPQIYIIFAMSKLAQSQSDLDFALSSIKKWNGRCTPVIIFTDATRESVDALTKGLKIRRNTIWGGDNKEFIEAFNVKNAPAYFRIDYNGKIVESPAAKPADFSIYD